MAVLSSDGWAASGDRRHAARVGTTCPDSPVAPAHANEDVPLVVDLDGTLIRTDSLAEVGVVSAARRTSGEVANRRSSMLRSAATSLRRPQSASGTDPVPT